MKIMRGVFDLEKEKKGWFSCLLQYAAGSKGKLLGSVILSVVSVSAGLVPYYCIFRLIEGFTTGELCQP